MPSGPQTINPTVPNEEQSVVKLLSKKRDDLTVQSPGIGKTARCVFQKIQYEFYTFSRFRSISFVSSNHRFALIPIVIPEQVIKQY